MNLKKMAISGAVWVTLANLSIKALNLITTIVLARLLLPGEFGLASLGLIVINFLNLFSTFGIGTALIYKQKNVEEAVNSTFVISIFLGAIFFIIGYFTAPFVSNFYKEPVLEPIIKFLSASFIVSALSLVPSTLLEKNLLFKKKFLPEVLSILVYTVSSILFAFFAYGIWSIAFGYMLSKISELILLWALYPVKISLKIDKEASKELLNYGKHMIGASFLIFLLTQGDDAFVGKFLGTSALGFYAMAYLISNAPATSITHLINKAVFPVYSKLQDNKILLKTAYLKTLRFNVLISIPASFGLFILAPQITALILGEKWLPMVSSFRVLCIFGLVRSILATTGTIFNATGKPDILKNLTFFQLIILGILIYPLSISYGIVGTSIATTLSELILGYWILKNAADILNEKIWALVRITILPLVGALVMISGLYFMHFFFAETIAALSLFVFIGFVIYSFVIIIFAPNYVTELKEILQIGYKK